MTPMTPIASLEYFIHDLLFNKTSNVFYVVLADAHHQLTHSCLGDNLKFNICKLESSYLANSDVPDLESELKRWRRYCIDTDEDEAMRGTTV
jgi:hypothetical protein